MAKPKEHFEAHFSVETEHIREQDKRIKEILLEIFSLLQEKGLIMDSIDGEGDRDYSFFRDPIIQIIQQRLLDVPYFDDEIPTKRILYIQEELAYAAIRHVRLDMIRKTENKNFRHDITWKSAFDQEYNRLSEVLNFLDVFLPFLLKWLKSKEAETFLKSYFFSESYVSEYSTLKDRAFEYGRKVLTPFKHNPELLSRYDEVLEDLYAREENIYGEPPTEEEWAATIKNVLEPYGIRSED